MAHLCCAMVICVGLQHCCWRELVRGTVSLAKLDRPSCAVLVTYQIAAYFVRSNSKLCYVAPCHMWGLWAKECQGVFLNGVSSQT